MAIDYQERIPNNVDLGGNRALKRYGSGARVRFDRQRV